MVCEKRNEVVNMLISLLYYNAMKSTVLLFYNAFTNPAFSHAILHQKIIFQMFQMKNYYKTDHFLP